MLRRDIEGLVPGLRKLPPRSAMQMFTEDPQQPLSTSAAHSSCSPAGKDRKAGREDLTGICMLGDLTVEEHERRARVHLRRVYGRCWPLLPPNVDPSSAVCAVVSRPAGSPSLGRRRHLCGVLRVPESGGGAQPLRPRMRPERDPQGALRSQRNRLTSTPGQ